MESIISDLVQSGSDKTNIKLSDVLPVRTESYKDMDMWIRVTQEDFVDIRKISDYIEKDKKIILEKELSFIPTSKAKYDIGEFDLTNKALKQAYSQQLIVNKNSNKSKIMLNANDKKMDKIYDNYWIRVISGKAKNDVRLVKEYLNNTFILDYELSNDIVEGDKIILLQHYFNDYIMFGIIDFTDFLGMDFSSLIDGIGGLFNFQITSAGLSLCCCIIIVVIVIAVVVKKKKIKAKKNKGLFIPGVGNLSPQQPLVIQMPMQTKPYPFANSPFPRST
jgi:hypothetical protein